jgi:HD-GYP domain-containing protein (c-di-GMP phosphodiesterase class II)
MEYDEGSSEKEQGARFPGPPGDGRLPLPAAVVRLVRRLECHDPFAADHARRVAQYSGLLARALGLDFRKRRQLRLAARLHDIGKVAIPRAILLKPGPLSAEEYRHVQMHALLGECLLAAFIRSPAVLTAVRNHHERHDGLGYPDGLEGGKVPLPARLIAVADCYDALTSTRPYRPALSPAEALDQLRAGAGTQFDPLIVEAFVAALAGRKPGGSPRQAWLG